MPLAAATTDQKGQNRAKLHNAQCEYFNITSYEDNNHTHPHTYTTCTHVAKFNFPNYMNYYSYLPSPISSAHILY